MRGRSAQNKLAPRILLLTPPMVQLNTPYPATAYLTGYLKLRGFDVRQADPAIELVNRLFSRSGLDRIRRAIEARWPHHSGRGENANLKALRFFLEAFDHYHSTVQSVMGFLQGRDSSLAVRLAARSLVPEGPRFSALDEENLAWAFGSLGTQDRAKYIASLYLDDLADVVRLGVDERFELSRYGEKLAASQPEFGVIRAELERPPSLVDQMLEEITDELLDQHEPDLLGLSVPFPGNLLGALVIARRAKASLPKLRIVLGGGYVNTELRELSDPGIFDYVDYITLDDGEVPLERIALSVAGKLTPRDFVRTMARKSGRVVFLSASGARDVPFSKAATPTYEGLELDKYLSVLEMLNPMHRIWSDARWNKLTLAHGCYWRKCSFCDISLDYIARYESAGAAEVADRMETMIAETGSSGFHFVDEAAPPAMLRALSRILLERKVVASWWGNIRFEKSFTPELARLMADAGCIAVSGGLEVASDRLLNLMQKGVTVEQVARVTHALSSHGILVHAYLMYGFPTQTEQETIDSLERVRQLFAAGCLHSAYWHRFSVTAHSPVGKDPRRYGIELIAPGKSPRFARNDLQFRDPTGCDHDRLAFGLRKAVYNYMHGIGLDDDVRVWFDHRAPKPKVPKDLIARAIAQTAQTGRGDLASINTRHDPSTENELRS